MWCVQTPPESCFSSTSICCQVSTHGLSAETFLTSPFRHRTNLLPCSISLPVTSFLSATSMQSSCKMQVSSLFLIMLSPVTEAMSTLHIYCMRQRHPQTYVCFPLIRSNVAMLTWQQEPANQLCQVAALISSPSAALIQVLYISSWGYIYRTVQNIGGHHCLTSKGCGLEKT